MLRVRLFKIRRKSFEAVAQMENEPFKVLATSLSPIDCVGAKLINWLHLKSNIIN
jgi:hypothetical protein